MEKQAKSKARELLVAVRVSEDEHKLLTVKAQQEGKTVSALLRENLGLELGRQSKAGRGKLAKRKAA